MKLSSKYQKTFTSKKNKPDPITHVKRYTYSDEDKINEELYEIAIIMPRIGEFQWFEENSLTYIEILPKDEIHKPEYKSKIYLQTMGLEIKEHPRELTDLLKQHGYEEGEKETLDIIHIR